MQEFINYYLWLRLLGLALDNPLLGLALDKPLLGLAFDNLRLRSGSPLPAVTIPIRWESSNAGLSAMERNICFIFLQ